MTIKIFTTGGTIDKTYFDQKDLYHVGKPQASGVLERANVTIDYEVTPIMQKDSLDLDDDDRELIKTTLASTHNDKIVVTHGTDTMVETARHIGKLPGKRIVLTGSMYPAQYRDSDAVFNMGCALMAVQIVEPGIYIAINGRIFDPITAVKNVELNRFEDTDE